MINFAGLHSVTLAQFVRGLSTISPNASKQQRMKVCFEAFDLNGDGFVDPPEMQAGFTSLYTSMDRMGDMHMDPQDIHVAVATLVNSPANQGGDLNLEAFAEALVEAGGPGVAIAECFRKCTPQIPPQKLD